MTHRVAGTSSRSDETSIQPRGGLDAHELARERDLLLQLLELGGRDDVEDFLRESLVLLIAVAGARRACIELRASEDGSCPSYRMAHCMDDAELNDDGFSRTVIDEAFATCEPVFSASAMTDPRFEDSRSVKARALESVLCVPMGGTPPVGVVYLQDRLQTGPFTEYDLERTQVFARHAGRVAGQLLWHSLRRNAAETIHAYRSKLAVASIVGSSHSLATTFQQLATVAQMNVGVLLTGESGTGKTEFARAIHDSSPRARNAFVELNCAALPETLFESELFGAMPGGHSTALKRVAGKIEAAHGGTLFLDEIGELSLRSQAKLLQVLQSGTYFPLGASVARQADIRVVAATNADLQAAVRARTFREDLFYRLNVFPIRVPSLAERRGDIPELAAHFVQLTCLQNQLRPLSLMDSAIMALQFRDWPGNVRELSHAVQAAALRAHGEGSPVIERRHVTPQAPGEVQTSSGVTFQEATRRFQASLVKETLERENWNVAATARSLDLTRAHLYNLLGAFELERPRTRKG